MAGAAGERELSPARRGDPPTPHAAPAHKAFSDRTSLYHEITDEIIADLERGRVPWVQPWLGSGRGVSAPLGLGRDAATVRPYSGINIMILWSAVAERGFRGQAWVVFRQALELGAHVRKGEKGTTVVYADRFRALSRRDRRSRYGMLPLHLQQIDAIDAATTGAIRNAIEPFAGNVIAKMVVICALLRAATRP